MEMITTPVRRHRRRRSRRRRARTQVVLGAALVAIAFAVPAVLAAVR